MTDLSPVRVVCVVALLLVACESRPRWWCQTDTPRGALSSAPRCVLVEAACKGQCERRTTAYCFEVDDPTAHVGEYDVPDRVCYPSQDLCVEQREHQSRRTFPCDGYDR